MSLASVIEKSYADLFGYSFAWFLSLMLLGLVVALVGLVVVMSRRGLSGPQKADAGFLLFAGVLTAWMPPLSIAIFALAGWVVFLESPGDG